MTDLVSAIIHFVGGVAAIAAAPGFLHRVGTTRLLRVGAIVHVFAIAFLLTSSTLFHFSVFALSDASPATQFLRRLDHIGIWLVIGGFFILPHLIGFRGGWRWLPLGIVWSAAAAGLVFKVFFFGQLNPIHNFILYAAASAVGIVSVVRFAWVYGPGTTRWVLACYGSYIAGAYFLLFKPLGLVDGFFGPHEIWHVGVLVGTWCHWAFVLWLTERVSSSAQPLTQVGVQPAELPLSEGVPSSLAPGNPMPSPIGSPAGFSGETSRFIGVVVEAVEESGSSLRSELPQRSPGG